MPKNRYTSEEKTLDRFIGLRIWILNGKVYTSCRRHSKNVFLPYQSIDSTLKKI